MNHSKARNAAFAKGNVTEENKTAYMTRFRLPHYVHMELLDIATEKHVSFSRLCIEILRTVADKHIAKREEEDRKIAEIGEF